MTLSTLAINYSKKQTICYILISLFCLTFGLIYEHFSHDVYSSFMMNAFLIPLIFGGVVSFLIYKGKLHTKINRISINLYNSSLATFTIYCIIRGVLEIYGTTNALINIYLYIGITLLICSVISSIILTKKDTLI